MSGERRIHDSDALEPGDGEMVDAPAARGVTFQRFDVEVDSRVDAPVLRWEGVADPERVVSLRAWSVWSDSWDIIESNIRPPTTPEMEQEIVGEFEVSSAQQRVLDGAGIPNGVLAGNHDNRSGQENGPDVTYNQR